MTELPPDDVRPGHVDHHAQLKVDYDGRHPGSPLPVLFGGLADHERIHELLAADYNGLAGRDAMSLDHQQLSADHVSVHNVLHGAYTRRAEEGAPVRARTATPEVDLDELAAAADRAARALRQLGDSSAAQWETIKAAAATLRAAQLREARANGTEDA